MKRIALCAVASCVVVLCASVVSGQDYPHKPIRIVTGAVGSGTDITARFIGPALSVSLGQPVVVENRTGGIIGREIVSGSPPDGYTLLTTGSGHWIGPLLEPTNYDPMKDFSPLTITNSEPGVLVVNPALPAKSVKELIALAKTMPGKLNYASASTGSPPHLAAELFKSMAGIDVVRVPYKSIGVGINDLIAGQMQMSFPGPNVVIPHIKSGRLRALAVTTEQPSALFPGLATIAASGLPGYEFLQVTVMFAPARTPDVIVRRLNQEIVRVLNRPDMKEKFLNVTTEVVGSSPEQLLALMKSDTARLGKVIKEAGIKAD